MSGAAATNVLASAYITKTKLAVCYQHSSVTVVNCVGLTKAAHGFVMAKGTQIQQLCTAGTTQLAMTAIDDTKVLACYVKAAYTRCKVLTESNGELTLAGSTVTTITSDGAAHFAVARFTTTTMVACYQGCAAAGCATAARVGVCRQLTLVNLNSALTVCPCPVDTQCAILQSCGRFTPTFASGRGYPHSHDGHPTNILPGKLPRPPHSTPN